MAALPYFEEKVHKKKLLESMLLHFFSQILIVYHLEIPHPEEPQPIETPIDTRALALVPSEPIPRLHLSLLPPHHEMTALHAHQEQIIATSTQHTAILRQIQHHLGIPSAPEHQMPAPIEPTAGDAETST
ncbi:hypothetical protein AAG906_010520 [Vitis piasezkii]